MGLTLKEGTQFKLVPPGQYNSVCVDVVDLGVVKTTWQGKEKSAHKCRLVFEVDERDPDTNKRMTISRLFTASLSEKSNLRPFLEAWRGKAFTAEELKGFDSDCLVGVGAVLQIVHNTKGDRTYDNINAIMKPMKGIAWLEPSGAYVRVKDRPTDANGAPPTDDAPPHDDEDSLPF